MPYNIYKSLGGFQFLATAGHITIKGNKGTFQFKKMVFTHY